ncbi:MAG TPA: 5-formyltetrahydrofolate cyclo-ligase, partial [Acidimicrobiales bacterium]|nr:5-formyltetrahydrofolate cyclo-ligase [Acidimicrobiales bacterium]
MERPDPSDDKATWRRWVRQLPPPAGAADVRRHLEAFLGTDPGLVGAYEVLPGEVDLAELVAGFAEVALPRHDGDAVTFHVADGALVDPAELDVLLVPGRAFDRRGIRLGRGGGHYDRFLPRLRAGVPVVGVTVDERVVPRLPAEPHDVPMTHLATESGVRAV